MAGELMADSQSRVIPARRESVAAPLDRSPTLDPIWEAVRHEALVAADHDPAVAGVMSRRILHQDRLSTALAQVLVSRLSDDTLPESLLESLFVEVFDGTVADAIRADLRAIRERDPVVRGYLIPFLSFKGFHALQAYRVTHVLWRRARWDLAVLLQNRIATAYGVDIHPAARLGSGILMDHATGIVIGETSVVEDNVSLLHEVTLGGTGKDTGDRHPKVRQGVLIGAGAKLLGNIEVGAYAKVGAGSVVLDSVPPRCTVAGVPARIVARAGQCIPAIEMDQHFPHSFEAGGGI